MRHGQDEYRQGQSRSDPETAGHVEQFGVVFDGIRRNRLEFQRHSTNGALSRLIALDFGMHRAGVDRPGRFLPLSIFVRCGYLLSATALRDEFRRIRVERRLAGGGAEVIGLSRVTAPARSGFCIHLHAADRIMNFIQGSYLRLRDIASGLIVMIKRDGKSKERKRRWKTWAVI